MDNDPPTPDEIQADLYRLVHALDKSSDLRLDHLAALPTVRAWRSPPARAHISEAERRTNAIEELIIESIREQPTSNDRAELAALFTFDEPDKSVTERHEAAGKARKVTADNYRVTYETQLLKRFAVAIYRAQFRWCVEQIEAARCGSQTPSSDAWWRFVEIDWSVAIDEADPMTEIWEMRSLLRCLAPIAQPVLSLPLQWTGEYDPIDPAEVEVLSGPQSGSRDDEFPHKLLHIRPASPSPVAPTAYIWDLGNPLLANEEVELAWRHPVRNRGNTGQPFVGASTRYKPDLRTVRLRARVPESMAVRPRAEEYAEYPTTTSSYSAPWVKLLASEPIARNADGDFEYRPEKVRIGHSYELWWGERAE